MDTKTGYAFDAENHYHSLDGKPLLGTSTVVGVISKPLSWWASGMACAEFGWTDARKTSKDERLCVASRKLEEVKKMDKEQYITLLDRAYSAHAKSLKKSAGTGTNMHSALEYYVEQCLTLNEGIPTETQEHAPAAVQAFVAWSLQNVQKFLYSEKHVYSRKLWTGGIFDLLYINKGGYTMLGDFKSSKEAYFSQAVQCAGYDVALKENGLFDARGAQISDPLDVTGYTIFPFGSDPFEPEHFYNTAELRDAFHAAAVLYQMKQAYEKSL